MTDPHRSTKAWLTCAMALAGFAALPAEANLVANPGFETGDFTGWTAAYDPNSSASYLDVAPSGVPPDVSHSGNYYAEFGDTENYYESISQSIPTTPGQSYVISFWVATDSDTNEPPDDNAGAINAATFSDADFQAYWNGGLLLDYAPVSEDATPYAQYTYTESATSSSTTLLFQGYDAPGFILLDDVSVTGASSVPEPATFPMGAAALALGLLYRKLRGHALR